MAAWETDPDPILHGGEDPLLAEDLDDLYNQYDTFDPYLYNSDEEMLDLEEMGATPLFLATAAN